MSIFYSPGKSGRMSLLHTHKRGGGIFPVAWTPWGVWCVADSQKQAVNNVQETGGVSAWPNTYWIIRTLLFPSLHRQAGLIRNHPLSPHYPWQATSIPQQDTVSLPGDLMPQLRLLTHAKPLWCIPLCWRSVILCTKMYCYGGGKCKDVL